MMTLLGLAVGAIGTLIGAGGGFILVPVFMWLHPEKSAEQITATSLAIIFFNALSGTVTYALKKRVDFRRGVLFAAAAVPGAIVGTFTVARLSRPAFDPIFAAMLALIAALIWFRRPPTPRDDQPRKRVWIGVLSSVIVGFLSSVLGIGGGLFHMPLFVFVLGYSLQSAVATSHFILCITSLAASASHPGAIDWELVLWVAPGVVVGAQVGAYLSSRLPSRVIAKGASIALVAVAARIALR